MKIMNLAMVSMLAMGTALTTLGNTKSAYASLTAPTNYDYSYTWNATASEQYLNVNGVDSIPLYTRTADGAYWNYTSTFDVIEGLTFTLKFNRSNTTWQASGTSWKPDEDKIGSDANVGSVQKYDFTILNFTNKDYRLYLDFSSTGNTLNNIQYVNDIQQAATTVNGTTLNSYFISSYQKVQLVANGTATSRYFDAWYLEDLGVSESYQEGYDANRVGILTDYLGTDAQQIGWVLLGIAAIIFVFKGGK